MRHLAHLSGDFQAIGARHLDVHQHHIEDLAAQQVQGRGAIAGDLRLRAHALKQLAGHLLVDEVVFHQEDAGVLQGQGVQCGGGHGGQGLGLGVARLA